VRAAFALSIVCWAATLGCGDGIGRPIVESEAKTSTPQAGSGGRSGRGGASSFGGFQPFAGRGSMWGGIPDRGVPDGGVPDNDYCASVADWPFESTESELALLTVLNVVREYGDLCATANAPAPPVAMKPELRCAARLHSRDMSEREFFDKINPDMVGPEDRMRRAGYSFRVAAESIAREDGSDPLSAFEELRSDDEAECANLMEPAFDSVGIGRYGDYLTLDFAGP
jgi:hypothetical protein